MKYISKFLSILILVIFIVMTIHAQQPGKDYAKNWKTVEAFEKKGLTNSALQEVMLIFNLALKAGNETQQVKAAMYQMKYRNMVEEDNKLNNIFYLDTLIAKTKIPTKNILQSMQAELLLGYKQNNRYRFYNRSNLAEEKSNDVSTWSLDKLNSRTSELYKASLKNEAILKNTSLKGLDAILDKGKNTRELRPTLYDLLYHRALEYFISSENDINNPSYSFIINDEIVFASAPEFIKATFITADTASLYFTAIKLFQDILQFHLKDQTADALLDADLLRLQFANEHGVFSNKGRLYESALLAIENTYPQNPHVAQAMFMRATMYFSQGSKYEPLVKKDFQYEKKRAKDLCELAVERFPGSEGAINCSNLLNQIKMPSLQLETESVNVPGQRFRSLVTYKNVPTVYWRIIKVQRQQLLDLTKLDYQERWKKITAFPSIKTWFVNLPDQKDFQEHATEVKIDALEPGKYMILASSNKDFSLTENIIAKQVIDVSNISYVANNRNELYVLDRSSGQPIANAAVQIWQEEYNYNSRKFETKKSDKYTSDQNGFVQMKRNSHNYRNSIQINSNNEELFLDENFSDYYYNSYEPPTVKKTFLFTDRSIYRPGQTVYFKGIVVTTDSASKKSFIVKNFKTNVSLFDVNGQKTGTLAVQTNDYGSFNGSFKLPEGLLNGQFSLRDSATNGIQYLSVEEYKRPKFFVEIQKPSGTYKLNDSITVTGNAKAYAGNNIDGAKVVYLVTRSIQYPIWYGWYGYGRIGRSYLPINNSTVEITHAETSTDANGSFTITFKAIPDETVDKESQPIFHFEVNAAITDINGETRTGSNTVSVAYQQLQLNIIAKDKLQADSIKLVKISTTNLNEVFEKSLVNVRLYKLIAPDKIFRERYWNQPDQFTMSKAEYYTNFPYDIYNDEGQPAKWPVGNKLIDKTDSTNADGSFTLYNGQLQTGWYKLLATTKDKNGETVKAEKYIQFTNGRGRTKENVEPIDVDFSTASALPGENINYNISTGFEKAWLITNLARMDKAVKTNYISIDNSTPFNVQMIVDESDRGGIGFNYVFVRNNRVYSGAENIIVPWNNKDLQISYETFRDKILPGAEEKWKIRITGNNKEKSAAEALISMYDASLDQFKPHNWFSLKSLWPVNNVYINWTHTDFAAEQSENLESFQDNYKAPVEKSYDNIAENGWNNWNYYGYLRGDRMTTSAPVMEALAGKVAGAKVIGNSRSKNGQAEDKDADGILDETTIADTLRQASFNKQENGAETQVRKNFNETAFFFPSLLTDDNGNIEFSFTIPEALTKWKLMTLAHNQALASGYEEKSMITQKILMVQPNMPRFLREGDQVELSTKIVNLADHELTGTALLELFDAANNKPVDGWFKNIFPVQYFTVAAGQSAAIKFPIGIPSNFNSVLTWRIKAITNDKAFSDGEEAALPVLTNRMLVTESMPLNMRTSTNKTFRFEKLLNSGSSPSLSNYALKVEYTTNPAWYAVQALPYLMEFPYECAEQNFNRYYANTLAAHIVAAAPTIKAVFEKWKITDSAALLSNLQKNEDLKAVLLQETPWVMQAKNETEQKKNIALLFDMIRMATEKDKALNKLAEMQSSNGGFTWFKGGRDDRYITQYILTGIGHLKKLKTLSSVDWDKLKPIVDKALPYLDARIKEDYDYLVKHKINLNNNNLGNTAIQYLYMRSFFPDYKTSNQYQTAANYYRDQSKKYWLTQSKYMQAMIALALYRLSDNTIPAAIIRSLKENSINNEEFGMYWKELASGGYYWYQAPIESQAMMIEAFAEIDKNTQTVDDLKTWLLKQKQTQNWKTTKATSEACYALLLNGSDWLNAEKNVSITLGKTVISNNDKNSEAGTGYFKTTIDADKIVPEMGNISVQVSDKDKITGSGSSSWGAVYWQYFEDLDKITNAETPLKLKKKLYIEKNTDRRPVLQELKENDELHIGDKVKVRIELRVDRDMEYIHMKDMRAACMEPVNVISTYKWQDGLGYYETTKDASTNFFFGWLPKGTYVFEYPLFVTHSGNFSNAVTTIQCMYAPEFNSHSEGIRINVAEK